MALFAPSESPAVVVKEIDLTGGVPNVQTSTGAYAGKFMWGPADQATLVANEEELVETFGSPDTAHSINFHDATYFLRYSNSLQLVRIADSSAGNAVATSGQTSSYAVGTYTVPTVKNKDNFEAQQGALDSDGHTFVARYPGTLGNSIRVSICPPSSNDSAFDGWTYKSSFDEAPSTSEWAFARNGTNDEVHVAVVDVNGQFSGTSGTVLESYPFLSVATDAKNPNDGSSLYIKEVLNERSQYVHFIDFDSNFTNFGNAGTATTSGTAKDFLGSAVQTSAVVNFAFDSGSNSGTISNGQYLNAFDLFEDKDVIEVDFLIAPGMTARADQTVITNDLISTAQSRKDCVVVTGPARNDIVNQTSEATITTNVVASSATFTRSDYSIVAGNYLKVYDKYNDQYIEIPANSSMAGLMAETDRVAAPWFSPAGTRRGAMLGVTSLNFNPNKTRRDTLYKAGVNPIVNLPGRGIHLFGDKTATSRPSAFDRINVRRLFLVLERAIERAAKDVLFEFNDEFTRAEFVNIIEPVLRDVKGRRGITDFRIVADETVNTAAVVDRNEFIANIFIKPARSINYITLNFVAVRSGVSFEEVTGQSF
jgi:hypothetical protein